MKKSKSPTHVTELTLFNAGNQVPEFEILKKILLNFGISPCEIIEKIDSSGCRLSLYFQSPARARQLQGRILELRLKGLKTSIKDLEPKDWRDRWKKDFHTFALTSRIDVVPVWEKNKYRRTTKEPIFLDTINAFGTGLHETTMFMARLIERCRGNFESFLDIGTGTGILSLVAFKNGVKKIHAIDVDENCIPVARANMRLNGLKFNDLRAVDVKKLSKKEEFDFVAANLVTEDLIRLKNKIISLVKPGKFLAVSGISLQNFKRLKSVYRDLPIRCLKVERGKEWMAILYQRFEG